MTRIFYDIRLTSQAQYKIGHTTRHSVASLLCIQGSTGLESNEEIADLIGIIRLNDCQQELRFPKSILHFRCKLVEILSPPMDMELP